MPSGTPPGGAVHGGLASTSTTSTKAYLPAPAEDAAVPWFVLSTRQSPDLQPHVRPEPASPARAVSLSGINPRVAAGPPPSPALPTRLSRHVAAGSAEPARAKSHSGWAPVAAASSREPGASPQRPLSSSGYGYVSQNGTLSGGTVHLAGAPAAAYAAGPGLSTAGSHVYDGIGRTWNGFRASHSGVAGTAGAGGGSGARPPLAGALRSVASFKLSRGSNRIAAGGDIPAAKGASVSMDGRLRLAGVDPALMAETGPLNGSRQDAQGYTGSASGTHPRARQTAPSVGAQETNPLSADGDLGASSSAVPSALSGVAALRAAGGMAGAVRTRSPASRPSRWQAGEMGAAAPPAAPYARPAASESGIATGGASQAQSPRASPLLQYREGAVAGAAAAAGGPAAPDGASGMGAAVSGGAGGGGRITSRLRGVGGAGRVSFSGAVSTHDAPASVRGPPYASVMSQPGSPTQPAVAAAAAAAAVPSLEPRRSANGEGGGGIGSGRAPAARLSSPLGSGFSRLRTVVNATAAAGGPAAPPAAPAPLSAPTSTDRPSAPSSSSWLAGRSRLFTRTQKRLVTPPSPAAESAAAPRRSTTSVGMTGTGVSGGQGLGLRQSEAVPQERGRGVSAGQFDFGLRATPLFGRRAPQAGGEEGYVASAPSSPSARPARAKLLRANTNKQPQREHSRGGGPVEWRDNMLARMQHKD